jgi:hypothetical protein
MANSHGDTMKKMIAVAILLLAVASALKADGLTGFFTYQNGTFTTIADIPSGVIPGASDIKNDNAGDILFTDFNASFLLSGDTLTPIMGPGITTGAIDISGNGTILGRSISNASIYFTDLAGTLNSLPNAPGFLAGLNDKGQIIGTSFDGQSNFVYDIKTGTVTNIIGPGGLSSHLIDINNNGAILGRVNGQGSPAASFIYSNGTFQMLAIPNNCAPTDMNDSGQVVGLCVGSVAGTSAAQSRGFLYNSVSGAFNYIDFNGNSNVNSTVPTSINDSGEIIGSFTDVPEPGALLQLTTGIGCLFGLYLCRGGRGLSVA